MHGGFLLVDPGLEFCFRHDLDHDRHEAVVLAAQLGALAAIDTRFVNWLDGEEAKAAKPATPPTNAAPAATPTAG